MLCEPKEVSCGGFAGCSLFKVQATGRYRRRKTESQPHLWHLGEEVDAKRSKTPHDPKNLTEDVSGRNCKHTVDACAS